MSGASNAVAAWSDWMLAMAWQVALLGVVVLVLDAGLRRFGAHRLRHGLWCLVALKLLLPPTLPSLLPLPLPAVVAAGSGSGSGSEPSGALMESGLLPAEAPLHPAALLLLTLYLAGALTLALRAVRRRRAFHARLRAHALPAPAWVDAAAHAIATRLGLRRHVPVSILPSLASPAIAGLLRPVILLPAAPASSSPAERRAIEHVLWHELAHARRGDLIAHAVFGALRVAYWFHPVVHLAARRAHDLREVCCDLTVAAHLREDTADYRDTLLEAAAARLLAEEPVPLAASFLRAGSPTLQRLQALDGAAWRHARTRRLTSFATAALLGALLLPMASGPALPAEGSDAVPAGAVNRAQALRDAEALLARTLTERDTFGCFHRRYAYRNLLALEESR